MEVVTSLVRAVDDGVATFFGGGLWHFFGPPAATFARACGRSPSRHALSLAGVNDDPDRPMVHLAVAPRTNWEEISVAPDLFYSGFDYANYLAVGNGAFAANLSGVTGPAHVDFLGRLAEFTFGDERKVVGGLLTRTNLLLAPAIRGRSLYAWSRGQAPRPIASPFDGENARDSFVGGMIVRANSADISCLPLEEAAAGGDGWRVSAMPFVVEDLSLGADDGGHMVVTVASGEDRLFSRCSLDRNGRVRLECSADTTIPAFIRSLGTLVRVAGNHATFVRRDDAGVTAASRRIDLVEDESVARLLRAAIWSASTM